MEKPFVTVTQGILLGSQDVDIDGNSYFSFQGIPYAKPPLGKLRFKAPVPAEKWNGVFDATKEGNRCYARDMFTMKFAGSENCLILNVFTKNLLPMSDLKPVMVWIHGGGWMYGSSRTAEYSPAFLMTQDVVIVTINYRLGILGFLNFQDPSLGVPGNAAFKDMTLALKWVQENIAHFGGDPKNVTIFGESAGAASVHLLMLSPMTKGLFHKAIVQSGSALTYWATSPGCSLEKLAEAAGKPSLDAKSLLEYLRDLSVEHLLEVQENMKDNFSPSFARPFVAVIEKTDQESAFLSEQPIDILLQGTYNQVPFMTGFTTNEGLGFKFFNHVVDMTLGFEHNIPYHLGYKIGEEASRALATKIKKYYCGSVTPTTTNEDQYFDLMSDIVFIYGQVLTVEKHLVKSKFPIFLYRMSIETGLNFFKVLRKMTEKGVCHCDDLGYLFKNFSTPEIEPGSPEDIGMRRFVKLWTNFAAYGNPTPDPKDPLLNVSWKPVERKDEMHFLEIGKELKMGSNPYPDKVKFWREIYANSPDASKMA